VLYCKIDRRDTDVDRIVGTRSHFLLFNTVTVIWLAYCVYLVRTLVRDYVCKV